MSLREWQPGPRESRPGLPESHPGLPEPQPGPREAVEALATLTGPYVIGVRHHSPAVAAAVPALLDAARPDVVCVELPADFDGWIRYLADPQTRAPIALAGVRENGDLGFYPFADFSPELAAIRWARDHDTQVVCCDLPLNDPGWERGVEPPGTGPADNDPGGDGPAGDGSAGGGSAGERSAGSGPARGDVDGDEQVREGMGEGTRAESSPYARALTASGTGRDDDLWDRVVEVLAPGSSPEAVRRAALGVGWALRADTVAAGGLSRVDAAREAHMRAVVAASAEEGRRVAAVVGAFHAPALCETNLGPDGTDGPDGLDQPNAPAGVGVGSHDRGVGSHDRGSGVVSSSRGRGPGVVSSSHDRVGVDPPNRIPPRVPKSGPEAPEVVTSLVPYAFDMLDARSGYPAGIRDPRWQQAVWAAGGDVERIHHAAAAAITGVCRELRAAGHAAGTGEATEALRLAGDLARLRGLPAPGRGELIEAVTTVLGQGETVGRGLALGRALQTTLVGTDRGRIAPGTPRSGLGPSVEAELAALRLPHPGRPESRELRLDPLRSDLDRRRETMLQRLRACGVDYGTPLDVAGTGDRAALSTKWRVEWTPAVPVRLDLAGIRGVTAESAATGTLREDIRREVAEGGPTAAQALAGLEQAARCDLPGLVTDRLAQATEVLPACGTLPELLAAHDLAGALRHGHLPGLAPGQDVACVALAQSALDAAVRGLVGAAGSDRVQDAAAIIEVAVRAGDERLGLRLQDALETLTRTGSPLVQGAAHAARVLVGTDEPIALGERLAGWVDTATTPESRRRLTGLLTGVLGALTALLRTAPTTLDALLGRIEALPDREFLDRLPALRGGFDALTPADRDRLLEVVTERIGDRPDLALTAPAEALARWTSADDAAWSALLALGITPGAENPAGEGDGRSGADDGGSACAEPHPHISPGRLSTADRWRLLLGRQPERLAPSAVRYAGALDELYGGGRGEGSLDLGGGGGGQERSYPTAREWSEELKALFGADVREEVFAEAVERGRLDVVSELDPSTVRPSVELLTSVLTLAGGLPEQHVARLRPLVKRLVDELARQLATRLRPALTGLDTPRPTRRPGGRLDLDRTLRANLSRSWRESDGRLVVVPERPMFRTRARAEADWNLLLLVDVSGSMEASVVWSALTAAVLGGVPTLTTHFLAFSTEVADLTGHVEDPLSLLLEVRVGGGTHIAAALAHARTLVTVPSRTLVVVVSDFEEGYPLGGLLAEVRALAASGAHLLGCAALDDTGAPRYSVSTARQLVAAGMPVAALSPLALARWVGDRLRGEAR